MNRALSTLFNLFPESRFKNKIRCYFYNRRNNPFVINYNDKIFNVIYPEWNLKFDRNPYHLLLEQEQYFKKDKLGLGDVVIDAGGFWGTFSLYASKKVGDKGMVVVFEPDSLNRSQLLKNIKLNEINNITVIDKGLWSYEGYLNFDAKGGLGSSFLSTQHVESMHQVAVTTIDAEFKKLNLSQLNFVKMDIEGAEIEALKGAQTTFLEYHPSLAIASYHIVDNEPTYSRVEKKLSELEYQVKTENDIETITYGWI